MGQQLIPCDSVEQPVSADRTVSRGRIRARQPGLRASERMQHHKGRETGGHEQWWIRIQVLLCYAQGEPLLGINKLHASVHICLHQPVAFLWSPLLAPPYVFPSV